MRRQLVRFSLVCVLLPAMSGCTSVLQRAPVATLHDLGSVRSALPLRAAPAAIDVRAPGWLDTTAIHYRLAYESGTERRNYAYSRWAATPAELLQVALRRMLDGPGVQGSCRLVVDIDEFIQIFEQPVQSRVLISGSAALVDSAGRRAVDRMRFSLTEDARTADVAGGVTALSRAVDVLGERLAGWVDTTAGKGRCGE